MNEMGEEYLGVYVNTCEDCYHIDVDDCGDCYCTHWNDFMLDNEFRVVDKFSGDNLKCCGDCGICQASGRAYCTMKLGKVIEVLKH